MAKALSHTLSVIRGSVGGLTYLSNQYHQIVLRLRTSPVQPGTNPQNRIKSLFAQAQALWKDLDSNEKLSWGLYAQSCVYSGPLGNYTVPGRLIFIAGYVLAALCKALTPTLPALSTTAPGSMGFFNLGIVAPVKHTTPGTGYAISVTNENADDASCLVEVSRPFELTRLNFKGPWDSDLTTAFNAVAASSTVEEVLGLVADKRYFYKVRAVNNESGNAISREYTGSFIAVTVAP